MPDGSGTLMDALLTPTRLYGELVKALKAAAVPVHGMAHITGGGLPENLPRCLPENVHAVVNPGSWERPALFQWLQEAGEVPEADLWNTFNLGVGFCVVVPPDSLNATQAAAEAAGYRSWHLGAVASGPAQGGAPLAGLPL